MQDLGARFEFDQAGDRLAVAAPARKGRHRHRVNPPLRTKGQQRVHAAAGKGGVQGVTRLEGQRIRVHLVAQARTDPAFFTHHHGDRLVHHADLHHRLFLGLDQGAARVRKGLGIGFNFLDHQTPQGRRTAQYFFEFFLFVAQF